MGYVEEHYRISDDEYSELYEQFGRLCHCASWQLTIANYPKSRIVQEFDDLNQEIIIAMVRAAAYYKRQVFIESALDFLSGIGLTTDELERLQALKILWESRKEAGNKLIFGEDEEEELVALLGCYSDREGAPTRNARLIIDQKFRIYCKAIIWNAQRSAGKQITKRKNHEAGMVSLSEFDFIGVADDDGISLPQRQQPTQGISIATNKIREALARLKDKRAVTTFDVLAKNPEAALKKSPGGIKLNPVRKATKMSYPTIRRQIKVIKEVAAPIIEEECSCQDGGE